MRVKGPAAGRPVPGRPAARARRRERGVEMSGGMKYLSGTFSTEDHAREKGHPFRRARNG